MENEIRQKILEFIHTRPRAVAEVASLISKNWRTADRYLEQLVSEDLIKLHVFRKGGRGALKIAYWPTSITETPSATKNFLFQRIVNGLKKEDFSALDIIQHISNNKRKVELFSKEYYGSVKNISTFWSSLNKAKKQILFFSGNLSFINMGNKFDEFVNLTQKILEKGVNINILTRVDITNTETIKTLLNLNKKDLSGKINIRYAYQPLRCTIIDEDICFLKENMNLYGDIEDEKTSTSTFIYTATEQDWINWLTKMFWHIWHGSIDAEKRLTVLEEMSKK